jgi:hypothetical protein
VVLYAFPLLMEFIGLPYGEYAKPSAVFQTISEIADYVLGVDVGSSTITPGTDTTLPAGFSDL